MPNTTAVVILVIAFILGIALFLRSDQANASEQDHIVQQMLIDLTANMKSHSEKSEVDFQYWADLNDALLGKITSHYNEDLANRFESTKNMIIEAESNLKEIDSVRIKDKQEVMLKHYIAELKTNKASTMPAKKSGQDGQQVGRPCWRR